MRKVTPPTKQDIAMPVPNYPYPPFKPQQQSFPGLTDKMEPRPDHGEDSYAGHGLLQGKRTLITGGDSGIGAAVAIAYAREGADVAIAYLPSEQHDAERIGQLIAAAGVRALLQPCDVSDRGQAQALIATVAERFGGLDVLVNNAAYQRYFHSFEEITFDEWEKTFATNVHAPFHLVQLAVPHMPEGGSIINTASKKIRVNAVLPGPIWTPFIPAGMDEDSLKEFGTQTPFGRPGQPAELASAYVLLAADTSSYTSGALLTIAGGAVTL
jgi:NAD(P)-dependent dehydrogenase (short-subunit alcohol dehydrogenase family)